MTNLSQLPTELLLLILQQLNVEDLYETVTINKRFYTLAMPFLWHTPVIKNTQSLTTIFTDIQTSPHSLAQHIRHFNCGSHLLPEAAWRLQVLKKTLGLQAFTLIGTPNHKYDGRSIMINENLQHLPQHWRQLTSLTLEHLRLSASTMMAVGRYCHHLTHLSLTYCLDLYPYLVHMLMNCPLEVLDMRMLPEDDEEEDDWRRDAWTTGLTDGQLKDLMQFQRLKDLTLVGFPVAFMDRLLTATAITTMEDGHIPWPHLVAFRFGDYHQRNDENLIAFLQSHPHIRYYGLVPPDFDDDDSDDDGGDEGGDDDDDDDDDE